MPSSTPAPSCAYSGELELLHSVCRGLLSRLHLYRRSFQWVADGKTSPSTSDVGAVPQPPACLSDTQWKTILRSADRKFPATDFLFPTDGSRAPTGAAEFIGKAREIKEELRPFWNTLLDLYQWQKRALIVLCQEVGEDLRGFDLLLSERLATRALDVAVDFLSVHLSLAAFTPGHVRRATMLYALASRAVDGFVDADWGQLSAFVGPVTDNSGSAASSPIHTSAMAPAVLHAARELEPVAPALGDLLSSLGGVLLDLTQPAYDTRYAGLDLVSR